MTIVTCGEKLRELSEKLIRRGSSVKILLVYLQGRIKNTSEECSMTLPRWGILLGGEYGELVTSGRRITEKGSSSLQTETFPTPLASDAIRMRYSEESLRKVGIRRTRGEYKKAGCNLSEYVAVFPDPNGMKMRNSGKLNPTWVEWLMGFPLGWTDLDASETR